MKYLAAAAATLLTISAAGIVRADVKAGVDAWAQGDYATAIREWRMLAEAGDADAQFNMGQAYKLGRGVPSDLNRALDYYKRATDKGHLRAEDNYGLLLFQQNRRSEAMPYLMRSADRGEARAQYLVGTALFNGDLVEKDWVGAYAMMSRSAESGLPQAATTLAQMDKYIPQAQRMEGIKLAGQMEAARTAYSLADAEVAAKAPLAAKASMMRPAPQPVRTKVVPPSRPQEEPASAAKAPEPKAPAPQTFAPKAGATSTLPTPAANGQWRVQLGAFSETGGAERQWKLVAAKVRGLSAFQRYLVPAGAMTRLQAGPLGSRGDADKLCGAIKAAGVDCIVKGM